VYAKGGYDILTGTIDNAVNLRFNSNNNLTVLGQLDQGPELTIAAIPNITDPTQLRGLSLMVDSPVSGYAYILRKVLSLYGLYLENGDYTFQVVGSTNLRYADLIAGHLPDGEPVYATILTYPFTSEASFVTPQPNILAQVSDFIQPFSSSALTASDAALSNSTERALIRSFVAAMYAANQYLAANSQKSQKCSIAAIAAQLNVSTAVATSAYNSALNPLTGETSSPGGNFTVSRQGLLNVIDVRSQFGGFAKVPAGFNYAQAILPGTGKLIDYSLLDEAIAATTNYKPKGNCQ